MVVQRSRKRKRVYTLVYVGRLTYETDIPLVPSCSLTRCRSFSVFLSSSLFLYRAGEIALEPWYPGCADMGAETLRDGGRGRVIDERPS